MSRKISIYDKIEEQISHAPKLQSKIGGTVGAGFREFSALGEFNNEKEGFFALTTDDLLYVRSFLKGFWQKDNNLQATIDYHNYRVKKFQEKPKPSSKSSSRSSSSSSRPYFRPSSKDNKQTVYSPACISFTFFSFKGSAKYCFVSLSGTANTDSERIKILKEMSAVAKLLNMESKSDTSTIPIFVVLPHSSGNFIGLIERLSQEWSKPKENVEDWHCAETVAFAALLKAMWDRGQEIKVLSQVNFPFYPYAQGGKYGSYAGKDGALINNNPQVQPIDKVKDRLSGRGKYNFKLGNETVRGLEFEVEQKKELATLPITIQIPFKGCCSNCQLSKPTVLVVLRFAQEQKIAKSTVEPPSPIRVSGEIKEFEPVEELQNIISGSRSGSASTSLSSIDSQSSGSTSAPPIVTSEDLDEESTLSPELTEPVELSKSDLELKLIFTVKEFLKACEVSDKVDVNALEEVGYDCLKVGIGKEEVKEIVNRIPLSENGWLAYFNAWSSIFAAPSMQYMSPLPNLGEIFKQRYEQSLQSTTPVDLVTLTQPPLASPLPLESQEQKKITRTTGGRSEEKLTSKQTSSSSSAGSRPKPITTTVDVPLSKNRYTLPATKSSGASKNSSDNSQDKLNSSGINNDPWS